MKIERFFARLRLADEFRQQLRPQRGVADIVGAALGRDDAGGRAHFSLPRRYLFGNSSPIMATFGVMAVVGHDDARLGVVVMDQLAADAAGRDHRDLAGLAGLRVAHGDDGLDAMVAGLGDGAADGDGFGTDRDTANIGVDVHAGDDTAVAGAHGSADLLPVVAIARADRFGGGVDQLLVLFAQHGGDCIPSSVGRPGEIYLDAMRSSRSKLLI